MAFANVQIGPSVASTTGSVAGTLPAPSTAGTMLTACLFNTTGQPFHAPAGWMLARQSTQGTVSRTDIWYYAGNPGGISSATFTATSGNVRAMMAEFSTAAGTTQVADATGTAGAAAPVTSFTVTAGTSSAAGDLGIAAFGDAFSVATTGQSWTIPAGYTTLHNTANFVNAGSASYKLSLGSGTQSVTASYSSSANQAGWSGVFAAFTETAAGGLSVTTASLADGKVGVTYAGGPLAATGGTPPYTWAISAGALPAGLSLTSSGGRGGGFGATLRMTQPPVSNENATTNWQALIGRPVTCQKWYTGGFPTSPDDVIQACIDLGMTCYLCYMPPFNPPTTAAANSLRASLQAFKDAGLVHGKVVLFQEVEDHAPTPAQYKAVVQFYEPVIHAVYPGGLVHDAAGSKPLEHQAYFPTTLGIGNLIDEYGIDYYANTYHSGQRIDAYVALVAATGKRFGVMEMGVSIGNAPVPPDTGPGSVTEYFNYVTTIAAANPPGSYMWYTQDNKNVNNIISDPADFRIPLLQALSDTVAGGSASGQITGTPTAAGLASFTARVTDNNSVTATAALTINITGSSPPVITTTALPAATVGVAYSQQVTVTGGTAPLTFRLTAGAVPAGLTLGAAGFIFGTPTAAAATSGFTVTVIDGNSQTASQALFITVVAAPPPPGPGATPPPGFPQIFIEAGFAAAAPVVPAGTFLLDDPVYGLLDTGILGDTTGWTDITSFARSASSTRTSTRVQGPLLTYQAATGSVVLKNGDGRFDPQNPLSPYAGFLRPMVPFRARAIYGSVEYQIISVFTDAWDTPGTNYGPNYSETTVTGTDGFKILAGVTLPAIPAGSDGVGDGNGEDSGARISRILDAAAWYTDHRRISPGDSLVQGTLYGDTALNLLQLTADSEIGELYIDGAGNVVYRNRQAILTDPRSAQPQGVFGDLPGAVHGNQGGAFLNFAAMGAADTTGAIALWEAWTGQPLATVRDYAGLSDFTIYPKYTAVTGTGRKLCLTLRPAYNPVSATDRAAMDTMLATMQAAGANVEIVLWHEPLFNGLSSAQYIAMVQYYAATVRKYYPLVFNTANSQVVHSGENSYYPGDAYIDKITTDYYGLGWAAGDTLDLAASIADNASPPKPFGIWEFNSPLNGGNLLVQPGSGFEPNSTGNWTATGNCTTAASNAAAHTGAWSLALTATVAANMGAAHCTAASITSNGIACAAGDSILASVWTRAATAPQTVTARVDFYTAGGAFISTLSGPGVTNSTTGWTQSAATVTAPATAAWCRINPLVATPAGIGEVHYFDDALISNLSYGLTQAQITAFYAYIQSYFATRAAAGKQNTDLIEFNGPGFLGPGVNSTPILDPSDFRLPLYQSVVSPFVFPELPYTSVGRASDDTQLANDIQATTLGGTLQEAEDLDSERTYLFPRSYARSDLLLMDDPTTLQWAQWVLSVSLTGDDRFDTLTITPLRDPRLWPHALGREIGDRITVIRRPPGGVPPIIQDAFIRGISHTIDASAGTWQTTWDLQSALRYTGFLILDDPAHGQLDTGKLAF